MNTKKNSLNYYTLCIDNKILSIERKYQDEKYQFFAHLARNSGTGTYGSRQRAIKIIDIKKKLIKEIISLMQECSIKSIGKLSLDELTAEEQDLVSNKIEKDFLKYVNEKITSSDELRNDGNIAQYGLAKALQEIDKEAKFLIDNIKGKFELIKQEKEILKKKKKIENLNAIPRNFHEHEYGYGIYLSWKSLESDYVKYYQIQRSNNKDKWENCKEKIIDAESNPGYNDHGGIIHREKGKIYTNCLPSGKTFYYRIRALDINREPISQWSDIAEATANTYKISLPETNIKEDMPLIRFEFIKDNELRKIIKRDYKELRRSIDNDLIKSTLLLCGSILEAILLDKALDNKNKIGNTEEQMSKWNLHKLKDELAKINIEIKEADIIINHIKDYRNIIHPGREKRAKSKISKNIAKAVYSNLDVLIDSLA
jgi:hypothetical protein